MSRQDVQARIALLSVEPAYENETRFGDILNVESKKWGDLLASLPQQK
jgi:hypothetical protein